ncbi:MAG: hypothetical protein IJ224_03590 [Lachnospiraceae bacterium]|nr:hypothetical protein [Lachnospiraceae bacterium]
MFKRSFKSGKFNKVCAWLLAVFIVVTFVFSTNTGIETVYAEGDEETYKISGYNKDNNITDSNGVTISGHSFCLDGLCDGPGTSVDYTRKRLSEIDGYTKEYIKDGVQYNFDKTLTDDVKSRLMKILIRRKDIVSYVNVRNIDITGMTSSIIDRYIDGSITLNNSLASKERTYKGERKSLAAWKADYDNGLITIEELKGNIAYNIFRTYWRNEVSQDAPQRLMWMAVYPEDFRLNSIQSGAAVDPTEFTTQQKKWYTSNDPSYNPIDDEYSLWNLFYKPLFDYIDTLPDYYGMGFDAWIYMVNDGHQNVLCDAVFINANLAKVDDAGNLVDGAVFQVLDENGDEVVDEWESDGENYLTINNLEIGKEYTIIEDSTPAGYIPVSEEIKFKTSLDNGITLLSGQSDAEILSGGVIRVKNDRTYVTILKTDSDGNPIPGAKFEIRDADNKEASGGIFEDLTKSSYTLYNLMTNSDHILKELEAPDGYIANTSEISFYIDSENNVILNDTYDGVTVDSSTNTISIVNEKETTEEETTEEVTTEEVTTEEVTTEEVTTEEITTEELTTEKITSEELTTETSTDDSNVTKSEKKGTGVTTGDKAKPMKAAILLLMSLDAILGMVVFKLLKS